MGSLGVVDCSIPALHLIHLGGDSPTEDFDRGLRHDGSRSISVCEHDSSTSSSADLVQAITKGLRLPSVQLSTAAVHKLQQQTGNNNCYTRHGTCSTASVLKGAAAADLAHQIPAKSRLLRSLPTELLYDDTGLQLFDQITHLSEYYLTSAEADILARYGPEIVRECVANGTSVIELGAGSMRKTKLLLDAVVSSGLTDVSFFALDLCEQSLLDALGQLQDYFEGQIQLAGLVGTYHQGLSYIQQQHLSINRSPALVNVTSATLSRPTGAVAANRGQSSTAADKAYGDVKHITSKQLAPAGSDDAYESIADTTSEGNSAASSDTHDAAATIADDDRDDRDDDSSSRSGVKGTSVVMDASGVHHYSNGHPHSTTSSSSGDGGQGGPGKLIMWLGSSIGNYNRDEAAAFLTQLKDLAMQPGDLLLVGIDRRNDPQKIAEAYNDAGGVTDAFIMNGMKHCKTLLDQRLQKMAHNLNGSNGLAAATEGWDHTGNQSSLSPEDFQYFCVYNDELGRHEAYYLALGDTRITLPTPADQGASPASVLERDICSVDIAAGELIHIEYSYKYSHQEVSELAAAAGLRRVRVWTDSKGQFDLHLLSTEIQPVSIHHSKKPS